jgi:hypothetical protein
LIAQPEVQERFGRLAIHRVPSWDEIPRWGEAMVERVTWERRLEGIAADYDGVLGDGHRVDGLLRDWLMVRACTLIDFPVYAVGIISGRPGYDRTMKPDTVERAVRSWALRPQAREQLNARRKAKNHFVGGSGLRSQRGHVHTEGTRDHGVMRADEMAAEEAGKGYSATQVRRSRERLLRLLGEVEHDPDPHPVVLIPARAGRLLVAARARRERPR